MGYKAHGDQLGKYIWENMLEYIWEYIWEYILENIWEMMMVVMMMNPTRPVITGSQRDALRTNW